MNKLQCWIALGLSTIVASNCPAQDDVAILLRRVPESADALLIVRLQALLQSPRGKQEDWANKYKLGYLNGAVRIPPQVKTMLMASTIQTHESAMCTTYGVALLTSKKSISMTGLAVQEGGEVVTVADKPVVLTSRNSFLVELAPGFMGALTPPNRKEMARWMRFAMSNRDPVLSPYLQNAVSAGRGAHIQLAVDLKDLVDPKGLRIWLKHCKKMQGNESQFDPVFELLTGLKGVRFTARVGDSTTGEVYLDLSKPVGDRANYLKELFLESLDEMGAAIDDFRDSQVRTEAEGKTVVLKAELADATLREIMSLIQMPSCPLNPEESQAQVSYKPGGKADLAATQRYYDAIQQLLSDLRKKSKKIEDDKKTADWHESEDYKKTAVWHETYAKKVAQLPRQGVDEEMLKYGATVSGQVWALANSLRGVPLKVDMLEGQMYYYPQWYIGRGARWAAPWLGYYGGDTNAPEIIAQQSEAISQGEKNRDQIWKTLDQEKYRIRRRMSEKYKTDFDRPKD
jgi:hypothetical protein